MKYLCTLSLVHSVQSSVQFNLLCYTLSYFMLEIQPKSHKSFFDSFKIFIHATNCPEQKKTFNKLFIIALLNSVKIIRSVNIHLTDHQSYAWIPNGLVGRC